MTKVKSPNAGAAGAATTAFRVNPRHFRSVQIDRDFEDPQSSDHYVVTPFIEAAHSRLAQSLNPQSTVRAWRLTGDYGVGKSSFGLAFAKYAAGQLEALPVSFAKAPSAVRLEPVLVLGEREPLARGLLRAVEATLTRLKMKPSRRLRAAIEAIGEDGSTAIVEAIEAFGDQLRDQSRADGLLVVLDELGKNLEYAAQSPGGDDLHVLQRLADAAERSGATPLVVVAVLHQGVSAYAEDLPAARQKEWQKVSGRFEELLFAPPIEQAAVLVAAALEADPGHTPAALGNEAALTMRHVAAEGWYGAGAPQDELVALAPRLLPLDPMVLPVLSRVLRRFGQNERSLFSFLSSAEPHGLMDHARAAKGRTRPYRLHDLYDYLSVNLASALETGSTGTRWAVIEGVLRSAPVRDALEVDALKTVGVINLLDDSGFSLTPDLLVWAVAGSEPGQRAVAERAVARITDEMRLIYDRGAGGGLCLWPHTSVDIEAAFEAGLKACEIDSGLLSGLREILPTEPVVARRHYVTTGALRHFDVLYTDRSQLVATLALEMDYVRQDGRIVVALSRSADERDAILTQLEANPGWAPTLMVGVPEPVGGLAPLLRDVKAWRWVMENTPGLAGDRIAREEIDRQLAIAEDRLRRNISALIDLRGDGALTTRWFHRGRSLDIRSGRDLAAGLSDICDVAFEDAPIVRNELINRRVLSSAAARARSLLIEALSIKSAEPLLGLDETHMPPEMAIYRSLIEAGGLHVQRDGQWSVGLPDRDVLHLAPTLLRIGELLKAEEDRHVPFLELAEALRLPPYGVRDGVFPLMLAIYLAIHWHHTAVYEDGTYLEQVGAPEFARMLKESEHFSIQHCAVEGVRAEVFTRLAGVAGVSPNAVDLDLLDVVRPLLTFVAALPDHARRTRSVSVMTAAVRSVLLRVHDPSALIFTDLPIACGLAPFKADEPLDETRLDDFVQAMSTAVVELRDAYPSLLERIATALRGAFGVEGSISALQSTLARRAEPLKDVVVEPDLKALVLRLTDVALGPKAWLESLASNMGRKPAERWSEVEEREFLHRLKLLGRRFDRVAATVASSQDRITAEPGESAFHVMITSADGREFDGLVRGASTSPELASLEAEFGGLLDKYGAAGVLAAARAIVAHQRTDGE
ncbi:hypothetical protein KOAAANKH_00700 [Brevundimonas sp. NIBR10]|nr:hypothetical protein KOAAANKH_00700 [Brevundimonas sp. NIBR10]